VMHKEREVRVNGIGNNEGDGHGMVGAESSAIGIDLIAQLFNGSCNVCSMRNVVILLGWQQ